MMETDYWLTRWFEDSEYIGCNNGILALTKPVCFSVLGEERTVEMFRCLTDALTLDWRVGAAPLSPAEYPCNRPVIWETEALRRGGLPPLESPGTVELCDPVDKDPAPLGRALATGASARLRPRGRLTRSLASLGGSFDGWWSDLAGDSPASRALAWFRQYAGDGAKIEFIRTLSTSEGVGETPTVLGIRLEDEYLKGATLVVCPELVASLVCTRAFRGLDAGLLPGLRSRARFWAKERGMSDLDLSLVISASCVFATLVTRTEIAAHSLLAGTAARYGVQTFGALSKGNVHFDGVRLGFWESLALVFRKGESRSTSGYSVPV